MRRPRCEPPPTRRAKMRYPHRNTSRPKNAGIQPSDVFGRRGVRDVRERERVEAAGRPLFEIIGGIGAAKLYRPFRPLWRLSQEQLRCVWVPTVRVRPPSAPQAGANDPVEAR